MIRLESSSSSTTLRQEEADIEPWELLPSFVTAPASQHGALVFCAQDILLLLRALRFSAERHKHQRRKDEDASPYINHPIQVAETLWRIGEVYDIITIVSALLHDTLEDTATTAAEINESFGLDVLRVVQEVSDDTRLPSVERKRLQIERAPHISVRAQQVKLADKICNVYDITHEAPPHDWTLLRKQAYLDWTEQVVQGLRGCNPRLEAHYDKVLSHGRQLLAASA